MSSSYLSQYEIAVKNGFRGTQEEWVQAIMRGEHNAMGGREKEDAHPMSSITGLMEKFAELEARVEGLSEIATNAALAAANAEAALATAIATTEETAQDMPCYDGEAYAGETVGETVAADAALTEGEISDTEGGEAT